MRCTRHRRAGTFVTGNVTGRALLGATAVAANAVDAHPRSAIGVARAADAVVGPAGLRAAPQIAEQERFGEGKSRCARVVVGDATVGDELRGERLEPERVTGAARVLGHGNRTPRGGVEVPLPGVA